MANVGDKGLKAQEQDCKGKSLMLSAEAGLLISLSGLPRHFVLRNLWIWHGQLYIASLLDSCCFSQTDVIAGPFASWLMNAVKRSWE